MSDIIKFNSTVEPGKIRLVFVAGVLNKINGTIVYANGLPQYTPTAPPPPFFNLRRATDPDMQESSRSVAANLTATLDPTTGDLLINFVDESIIPGVTYYYDVDAANQDGTYPDDWSETYEITAYGKSTMKVLAGSIGFLKQFFRGSNHKVVYYRRYYDASIVNGLEHRHGVHRLPRVQVERPDFYEGGEACAVGGDGTVYYPGFTTVCTETATPEDGTVTHALYDSNGSQIAIIGENLRIPDTLIPPTLESILIYNNSAHCVF